MMDIIESYVHERANLRLALEDASRLSDSNAELTEGEIPTGTPSGYIDCVKVALIGFDVDGKDVRHG